MPQSFLGLTGDRRRVRIGTRAAGDGSCTTYQAAKARPAMWLQERIYPRKSRLETFPLGAVMDALDDVEFGGGTVADALGRFGKKRDPLHAGADYWGRRGVAAYVESTTSFVTPAAVPVAHYWVVQRETSHQSWELYAWGRRYESADGAVREFRFLRYGFADKDKRAMSQVAIAAYSAAFGVPAQWPKKWRDPFQPLPDAPASDVQRVRVVEVGLKGGEPEILFDGTPEQAQELYDNEASGLITEVASGGQRSPGHDCAQCKVLTICPAPPPVPGLLGITDPMAPARTWSVSTGRYYRDCPAQEYLRGLHLPKDYEYDETAERGKAVHAWLAETHKPAETHPGEPCAPCTVWDTPHPADDWSAGDGEWHLTGHEARAGALMIANHADLCPLHGAGEASGQITDVRVEPALAFRDAMANVVIIANPDMTYTDAGAAVWRETKTRWHLPRIGPDLLARFPQIALAVLLMDANALGGQREGRRIELELLSDTRSDMVLIDPNDPAVVCEARAVIHALAAPWHADETHDARPGDHCGDCPVREWCPDAQ